MLHKLLIVFTVLSLLGCTPAASTPVLDAQSLDDMIEKLQEAADLLKAMRADGVVLDPQGGTGDDYARLVTSDPNVARKYDMHDETEFWSKGPDEDESEEFLSKYINSCIYSSQYC